MDLVEVDSDTTAKLKVFQTLCSTNENLENERNSVLQPTTSEPLFRELLLATEMIHVGWLLSPAGKKICGQLSLSLDNQEPGWRDLATELLEISLDLIMDINFEHRLIEGPTYTILCIYAQKENATIGKVMEALNSIKRYDVLHRLKDYVFGDKGLIKLLQSEAGRWNNDDFVVNELNRIPSGSDLFMSKPKLPPLPIKYEVFSPIEVAKVQNLSENIGERRFCSERMVTRDNKTEQIHVTEKIPTKRKRYKAIVMLTFSVDGLDCAKKIASALRKKCIGVLILDEHQNRLASNPGSFITELFPQVNYVIPIVTKGYLKALKAVSLTEGPLNCCADARYVKFIYTLMMDQYLQNGCINLKVRCIIPESNEWLMQEHPVVRTSPLLHPWLPERDIEVLSNVILSTPGPHSEE